MSVPAFDLDPRSLIRTDFSGQRFRKHPVVLVFWLFVVAQIIVVGSQFNWIFVDADQLVIAEQARWIAKGFIFEPNFYGQNYLIPIDSYLSAALVFLGINPLYAVQFCTAFFFAAPFFILSFLGRNQHSVFPLSVSILALLIPFKFLVVAMMARAFTTVTSISCIVLIYCIVCSQFQGKKISFAAPLIFGFCLGSFTGALVLVPALVLISGFRVLFTTIVFVFFGFLASKSVGVFYFLNPDYLVHKQDSLSFSFQYLHANWNNQLIRNPLLMLYVPGITLVTYMYSRAYLISKIDVYRSLLAVLGFSFVLLTMMATAKIADFMPESPFFSVERMFIGIPFFFLVMIANLYSKEKKLESNAIEKKERKKKSVSLEGWLLVALGAVFLIHLLMLNSFLRKNRETFANSPSPTPVKSVLELTSQCSDIKNKFLIHRDVYLTFNGRDDAIVYGCSAFMGLPIVQTEYERRTWLKRHFESNDLRGMAILRSDVKFSNQ